MCSGLVGDNASSCCGGDDRVLRHNVIRDVVCAAVAEFTAVSPEMVKPRPRTWAVLVPSLTVVSATLPLLTVGRPADVWVPRLVSGFVEAWDFSVSSSSCNTSVAPRSPASSTKLRPVGVLSNYRIQIHFPPARLGGSESLRIPASGFINAPAAPFTGKTRVQSSGGLLWS